jgi:hypothetical protein
MGHWARLIIDGQYNQVIEIVEQLDPEGDRALVAVADSLKEMVKAVQEREESLRQEISNFGAKLMNKSESKTYKR